MTQQINYLTTNDLKFSIAKRFFEPLSEFTLVRHSFEVPEIQARTVEDIACHSAIAAAHELGQPCIVMDAGFSIAALRGFPGPYVKYINEWLTEVQLLQMMNDQDDRAAAFNDALAIAFPDGTSHVFSSVTPGFLAREGEYVASRWPANSLFIPEGYSIPLGSMSNEEQVLFWSKKNDNWNQLIAYLT